MPSYEQEDDVCEQLLLSTRNKKCVSLESVIVRSGDR